MTRRSVVALVSRREVVERLRQRYFLVSTGVTLLIVAAVAILPAVLEGGDEPDRFRVAAVGPGSGPVAETAAALAGDLDAKIRVKPLPDRAAAEDALRRESIDAAVLDGRVLLTLEDLPDPLERALREGARSARIVTTLRAQGSSAPEIERALSPAPLAVRAVEGDPGDRDEQKAVAYALTLLLYLQILAYGIWVASGVVEEKSSRVIEILLSAIRPRQLLTGKVVGIGLLGLGQLLLVVTVGVALALFAGSLDVEADAAGTVAIVMLWFPLGYALYACLFAAAGALVSRQEDLQSTTTPLSLAIVASYLVSFSALDDPGGTLARVVSIVPLSSPLVMPARLTLGEASLIEVVVAVGLIVVTVVAVIIFAARVYERAVMRTGKPVGLREALRLPAR